MSGGYGGPFGGHLFINVYIFNRITSLVRNCIEMDVARRREYVRTVTAGKCAHSTKIIWPINKARCVVFVPVFFCAVEKAVNELQHVLPDYTIVFTIAVLANDPLFTDVTNVQQLRIIERSLWLVLEPLVNNKDYFSFTFYKTMVERIKKTKNALKPDDDVLNTVSCAHCANISIYKSNSVFLLFL